MNRLASMLVADRRVIPYRSGGATSRLLCDCRKVILGLLDARLCSTQRMASGAGIQGGTALSKVFGIIKRFSEDIDLSRCQQPWEFQNSRRDQRNLRTTG